MVWIPWIEKWVCFNCYSIYYKEMTLEKSNNILKEDPHPRVFKV